MNPLTPDPNASIWPPPPVMASPVQPLAVCPFRWLYRRGPGKVGAKANVSDIREGVLQFDAQGILIQGKAVPRAEIRTLVLVPCILLSLLVAVAANYIMEYAFRRDVYLGIRWDSVREITLSPTKQQACVIYDAPNYAGKIKTFSLALTPTPGYYDMLAQSVGHYAPIPITEDRLRNATPPLLWGILIVLLLFIFGLGIWAALSPHH